MIPKIDCIIFIIDVTNINEYKQCEYKHSIWRLSKYLFILRGNIIFEFMHVVYKNPVRYLVWALPQIFVVSFSWEYWQYLLFWNIHSLPTAAIILGCRTVEAILSSNRIPAGIHQWDLPTSPSPPAQKLQWAFLVTLILRTASCACRVSGHQNFLHWYNRPD